MVSTAYTEKNIYYLAYPKWNNKLKFIKNLLVDKTIIEFINFFSGGTFSHNEHSSTLKQISWEVSLNAICFGLHKTRLWGQQKWSKPQKYYLMQAHWSVPLRQRLVLSFQLQLEQCLWPSTWAWERGHMMCNKYKYLNKKIKLLIEIVNINTFCTSLL